MVAAVAADEPDTAANIPQLRMFTCSSLPGKPPIQGDSPLNRSSDKRVRNRTSPIQMNIGSAVRDQPVLAPQLEVANRRPIWSLPDNNSPRTPMPTNVSDTQTPSASINIMEAARAMESSVVSIRLPPD